MKRRVMIHRQFEFSNIDLFSTISKIQALESSKASSGNTPTVNKQDTKEVICPYLTNCINVVINRNNFDRFVKGI